MPRIGVVLSGCGHLDGAEIQESVLTLLALDRADVETVIMAPAIDQLHVVNHLTGKEADGEMRNVLVESARIARGNIEEINSVNEATLDALIFPGGFGVAKNLCDYAMTGADCTVDPSVLSLASRIHEAGKPIGAICIAPAMLAKVLENSGASARLTIGYDQQTASDINTMGSVHVECPVTEMIVDRDNKIVTTPAYMEGKRIGDVARGIEKLVTEVLALI